MESKNDSQENQNEGFSQDQVVWAKITGYPWWPAAIIILPDKKVLTFRVDFLCDKTHAYVTESKIAKYGIMRKQICLSKNMNKTLRMAIARADQIYRQLSAVGQRPPLAIPQVETRNQPQKQLLHQSQELELSLQENQINFIPNIQPQSPPQHQQEDQPSQEQMPTFSKSQRKEFTTKLLAKYKLMYIPKPNKHTAEDPQDRSSHRQRRNKRKVKLINKKRLSKSIDKAKGALRDGKGALHDGKVRVIMARKLYSLLSNKHQIDNLKKKQVSLYLSNEILGQKNEIVDNLLKLCKWIDISRSDTISHFYQNWASFQTEKEKASWMTNEE